MARSRLLFRVPSSGARSCSSASSFREQRIILNAIRFMANDLRIPLVCLGTDEANQALMTDPQLADRFAAAELPAWEDDAAFEQLLLSFESILPLRQPSEFRDPKIRSAYPQPDRGRTGPYLPADGNSSHRRDPFRRRAHQPSTVERRSGNRVSGVDRGQAYSAFCGMMRWHSLRHGYRLLPNRFQRNCYLPGCCGLLPPISSSFRSSCKACSADTATC